MNLFVFFAVFAQLAFSIAIVGMDDQDDLIMDSNESFLLDRIDLNSLDIIEAKKRRYRQSSYSTTQTIIETRYPRRPHETP